MRRRALITRITGQDGPYLAEFLLEQGYEVFGTVRRSSSENFRRIGHLRPSVGSVQADLLDQLSVITVLQRVRPHEVYNLAARSFRADIPVMIGSPREPRGGDRPGAGCPVAANAGRSAARAARAVAVREARLRRRLPQLRGGFAV